MTEHTQKSFEIRPGGHTSNEEERGEGRGGRTRRKEGRKALLERETRAALRCERIPKRSSKHVRSKGGKRASMAGVLSSSNEQGSVQICPESAIDSAFIMPLFKVGYQLLAGTNPSGFA